MKIYYDNQVDNATVTSDQTITNYPPSNVKHSNLSRIYKGAEYSELQVNAGGGLKNISEAYTNLVQDPTDLTTSNWTKVNGIQADSTSLSILGHSLTKISMPIDVAGTPYIQSSSALTLTASVECSNSIILQNGNYGTGETVSVYVLEQSPAEIWNTITVRFDNQTVTQSDASRKLKYVWNDDKTVIVNWTSLPDDTDGIFRIVALDDTTKYFYATACQVVDNTDTFYPFISGSKTADTITEDFTMPDRFTFDMVVTPFFQYDSTEAHTFFEWYINTSQWFIFYYRPAADTIEVFYGDKGTNRRLTLPQMDDGTTYINLNQKLRLVGSIDLVSGNINSSRAFLIQENGTVAEVTSWDGTPDIKTATFNSINIGYSDDVPIQSNSEFEYLRIYEGLLVGTVSSSSDVDTLLQDKKILLDKTYQSKITATDLLLANTTINDGDTILLRANDVDSFNAGTPVDEVVTWDKNIIHHNFTKASHQYWWLSVNSSNAVEIGRMYLGESYTPPGIGPTVTEVDNTADVESFSTGGQLYGDKRFNFKQFITTHPYFTHDQIEDLDAFFSNVTNIKPYFLEFDEECSNLTRYYVKLEQSEIRKTTLSNPSYYTASMNHREVK